MYPHLALSSISHIPRRVFSGFGLRAGIQGNRGCPYRGGFMWAICCFFPEATLGSAATKRYQTN
jgi:hypothetical protein